MGWLGQAMVLGNFQCWGVQDALLRMLMIIVGQGLMLAVGVSWGCLDTFSLVNHFYFLSKTHSNLD